MTRLERALDLLLGTAADEPEDPVLLRLAYDEARKRLDAQERALDELRGRSGTLIAASSIVTSFFASRLPEAGGTLTAGQLVATGGFAVTIVCCLLLLLPLGRWRFYFGTRKLLNTYVENDEQLTVSETYRELALHLEDNFRANENRLGGMYWLFAIACAGLFVEVIAWVAVLFGKA